MKNARKISAVVFDLDGLMLNTEDVFELAGVELMARRGLVMTDELRHSMMGRRPVEAFTVLKSLTGISDKLEDLMLETKVLFEFIARDRLSAMPGLHEVLELIDDRKLPRGVATSSPRSALRVMGPSMQRRFAASRSSDCQPREWTFKVWPIPRSSLRSRGFTAR